MTAQAADKIFYKGKEYRLHTNPMQSYFEKYPEKFPKTNIICSSLWRGYVATFEINDNQLYLKDIEIMDDTINVHEHYQDRWKNVVNEIFPNQEFIKADWFTGSLKLASGELLRYVHLGYESTYEHYTFLEIENGDVKSEKQIHSGACSKEQLESQLIQWWEQHVLTPLRLGEMTEIQGRWYKDRRCLIMREWQDQLWEDATWRPTGPFCSYMSEQLITDEMAECYNELAKQSRTWYQFIQYITRRVQEDWIWMLCSGYDYDMFTDKKSQEEFVCHPAIANAILSYLLQHHNINETSALMKIYPQNSEMLYPYLKAMGLHETRLDMERIRGEWLKPIWCSSSPDRRIGMFLFPPDKHPIDAIKELPRTLLDLLHLIHCLKEEWTEAHLKVGDQKAYHMEETQFRPIPMDREVMTKFITGAVEHYLRCISSWWLTGKGYDWTFTHEEKWVNLACCPYMAEVIKEYLIESDQNNHVVSELMRIYPRNPEMLKIYLEKMGLQETRLDTINLHKIRPEASMFSPNWIETFLFPPDKFPIEAIRDMPRALLDLLILYNQSGKTAF